MLEFLKQNAANIAVGAVVFGIFAAVVVKLARDHKNHKSSCGCGCEGCPGYKMCHSDSNRRTN